MTKPKAKAPAPKDSAPVHYHVGKERKSADLALPVQPGEGEALLNAAEREGCTDIEKLRGQISKLPHA